MLRCAVKCSRAEQSSRRTNSTFKSAYRSFVSVLKDGADNKRTTSLIRLQAVRPPDFEGCAVRSLVTSWHPRKSTSGLNATSSLITATGDSRMYSSCIASSSSRPMTILRSNASLQRHDHLKWGNPLSPGLSNAMFVRRLEMWDNLKSKVVRPASLLNLKTIRAPPPFFLLIHACLSS